MAQSANDELSILNNNIKKLLAIELWRGGLSQKDIGKRIGISINAVNDLLKGVKRELSINDKK